MTPEQYLPIIISSLSLVVSGFAFIWTKRYNTSDFKLSQKVKDDTLELLSTLRSLDIKAIQSTQGMQGLTITKEKEKINNFLLTPTSFAYNVWVGQKSKTSGNNPEQWRIFYLRLTQILNTDNLFIAGSIAAELEELFDTITKKDFKVITSYLQNVPEAMLKLRALRQYDGVIQGFMNMNKERRNTTDQNNDYLLKKLLHLKNKGIHDPNIDLFIGVLENNKNIVQKALDDDADPSITDTALLEKYKMHLIDFGE